MYLFSKLIKFDRCLKIFGNIISISDTFIADGKTRIGPVDSGCGLYTSPGSPIGFASQSFNCSWNGGSFGGRGGVGVSASSHGSLAQSFDCLRNSFEFMTEYGDPMMPVEGGATGTAYYNASVTKRLNLSLGERRHCPRSHILGV